ncbi:MAG: hypothetical protein JO055_10475 [Alphaproteobacteria bacterium]|nr:hypothetical protein [Alphaproteobacteria bacterium]
MDGIHPIAPPDVGDEMHMVRRLGWALLYQWDRVPDDLRDRLIEQAVFTQDRYQTAQLKERIAAFVGKHAEAFKAQKT